MLVELIVLGKDAVSRGARAVGDNVALLPDEGIEERRLTCIRSAHDRKARQLEERLMIAFLRE